MIQEKIDYDKIMALGFNEQVASDSCYEAEHGYAYCIITKNLTKKIYLDWQKDTKLCKMVRIDSPKTGNVKAETPIMNLEQIKTLINFFSNEPRPSPNYYGLA